MDRLATLVGLVVPGEQRGRTLGFPTANVTPDEGVRLPPHGVYAGCATRLDSGEEWWAAVSVGMRPTFESALGELVEAYLLDFEGDLYETRLRLDFFARLRGEIKFEDATQLIAQMERDVADVRRMARAAPDAGCGALQAPRTRLTRHLE